MVPSQRYCTRCGAANQAQDAFCFACGQALQVITASQHYPLAGSATRTSTGLLIPNLLLKQRYRILGTVGKGGFGAVYRAEDVQLGNRLLAVKEMSQSSLNPQEIADATENFKREALLLAALKHPNLPSIYEQFSEAGRWYLVMDFIEGETLEEHVKNDPQGHLSVKETLQIGIQLCTVLAYLHSRQPPVIFRDLKPSNSMLTPEGHLYLIDFGIARHFKPGQTRDTIAFGSPGYAAPEQYGKAQTTARSDIYSLGATLHHLLTGVDPSDTPFHFAPLQLPGQPTPPDLKLLLMQMLEMNESNRPASMIEVKQELQRILTQQTVGQVKIPQSRTQPSIVFRAADTPSKIGNEPPWKLPDTTMLNTSEQVKRHMLDDSPALPYKTSRLVTLREVLESKEYLVAKAKSKLTVALGRDVAGTVRIGDLAWMPHLLLAGTTGSGKSICIHAVIGSILVQATPDDVRMLMVDPKMVELVRYNGIPHLLAPVVTEVDKVAGLLKVAIAEMEKRYRVFSQLGVRNLDSYRKLRVERLARGDTTLKNLPAIVIIIDELVGLMMSAPEEIEGMICRLAQSAFATGIHLVIATLRLTVDMITGLIKANIPTRISFRVTSAADSRIIIDKGGAERLLGRGDMLYLPADAGKLERIQGAFVADDEADRLISYWKKQAIEHAATVAAASTGNSSLGRGLSAPVVPPVVEPGWEVSDHISDEYELDDELLEQAEQVVYEYERASISLLQRRLRIGYSRAARLIDLLEERGIIGKSEAGGRSRSVLERKDANYGGGDGGGEGRTLADEADDIVAEQKAREEFLKARDECLKKQRDTEH